MTARREEFESPNSPALEAAGALRLRNNLRDGHVIDALSQTDVAAKPARTGSC
jgi:hypothetical protein